MLHLQTVARRALPIRQQRRKGGGRPGPMVARCQFPRPADRRQRYFEKYIWNQDAALLVARLFVDRQRDGPAIAAVWSAGSRVHDIYSVRETHERRGLANHRHVASMVRGVVVLGRHINSIIVDQDPIAGLIHGPRQFSRRIVRGRDLSSFRSERAPELLEDWLHQVAPRRRRELEIARCAVRRRRSNINRVKVFEFTRVKEQWSLKWSRAAALCAATTSHARRSNVNNTSRVSCVSFISSCTRLDCKTTASVL